MNDDLLSAVWRALSEPSRRRMLDLLRDRPRTTGELAAEFEYSRFAAMKHLRILEEAGLVVVRRQGRERFNHLNPVPIRRIYERWITPFTAPWAASLTRLKTLLEAQEPVMPTQTTPPASRLHLGSLSVHLETPIAAPPERVFLALTREVSAWWGAPYLVGEATDILLDPRLGGDLREVWGEGEGALWGRVTAWKDAETLQITGPCGMSGPVHGVIDFRLSSRAGGTLLSLAHAAVGGFESPPGEVEVMYQGGWQDLLGTRLKSWVEDGKQLGLAGGAR